MADREEILLVEDDPDVAAAVSDFLEHRGYAVLLAHTGEDGLKILQRTPVSVALLDLRLPDLDGVALMKEVRRLDCPPDVVVMTGHATLESAIEAIEAGAAGYLLKPVDFTRLGDLVGRLFEQRLLRRENARLSQLVGSLSEKTRHLAALHETASALSAELSLEALLQELAERARRLVEARYGALAVLGADKRISHFFTSGLTDAERERVGPPPEGRGLLGVVLREGKRLRLDDIRAHPRSAGLPAHHPPVRSLLAVPIFREEEVKGALYLAGKAGGFTEEDERVIVTLAADASIAIHKASLFAENDRRRKAAEALSGIARTLGSTLELKQLLKIIAQRTARAVGAERCSINLWRDGRIIPVMSQFADGHSDPVLWEKFKAMGGYHLEEVPAHAEAIRTRRPVAIEDVRGTDLVPASWGETFGVRSILAIPLIRKDEVIGILNLDQARGPHRWTEEQIDLAMTIAGQAALALENARLFGESERRRRVAESLIEVGGVISQSLDPHEVAQRIIESLRVLLRATTAMLFELVPQTEELVAVAASEDVRSFIGHGVVFPKGAGVVGLAVSEGRPVTTSNLLTDPRITFPPDLRARVEQASYRAVLSVPLITQDRIIGALVVGDGEGRVFEREEVRLAQAFADQAALALRNAELVGDLKSRRAGLEELLEVTRELSVVQGVEAVLAKIAAACGRLLGSNSVGFRLLEGDELVLKSTWGDAQEAMPTPRLRVGESLSGLVAATGEPLIVQNVHEDPRLLPAHRDSLQRLGYRAWLGMPLKVGDRLLGVLSIRTDRPQGFGQEDLATASAFASQAAIALENARLYEEIRGARDFLQSIAENSADGIITTDVHGRLTYMSPGADEMFGYRSGEILGRRAADFYRGGVDEARGVMKRLGVEGRLRNHEVSIRARDGRWVQGSASYSLLRDASGEIVGTLGILKDITEQKQLEETLRQSQKMEAVGRLAGGLAHDFNNLLTVITGRAQILMDRLRPEDPMRRDIELFRKTSERAAALTRQLLAFSRKQVLQPKVLDLTAIVANMDSMLRRLIGEDIELLTVREPDLWRVKADAAQIEQVIVNLAVNARDAMPNGGKLTLETANVVLNGKSAARHVGVGPGSHVMLAVSDTGVGMDAATRARIFEPFFTTKEPGKGTGLGLATVYGIVKQSGGTIWVDSEPGRGATFKIYLPRVEEAADPPAAGAAPAEPQRGIETILVAEDEDELRAVAREALEMYGYTVLEAADPDEALVIAERHAGPIHLLVTDVVMPRMNGRELVRRLAPLRPETKVLYVSGYADDAIARHGVLDPGTAFLEKPFDPKVLARKVREVLGESPTS